jgi:hypothetical protein
MSLKLSGIKGLFHGTLQMRRVVELTGLGAAQVLGSVQRGNGGPEYLGFPGGAGSGYGAESIGADIKRLSLNKFCA